MSNKRGFTLIELLVVVAIIVALLAILLPAMGQAVHQAQMANHLSNLRQIGAGFLTYSSDSFGHLPEITNGHDDSEVSAFMESRQSPAYHDLRPIAERYGFMPATAHVLTGSPAWDDPGNTRTDFLPMPMALWYAYYPKLDRPWIGPSRIHAGSGRALLSDLLRQTPTGEFYGVHYKTGASSLFPWRAGSAAVIHWSFDPVGMMVVTYDQSARLAPMSQVTSYTRFNGYEHHYYSPHE